MTLIDRFSHSPANPSASDEVECSFLNPALANQQIDVLVRANGEPYQSIPITIDSAGFGSFAFTCPDVDVLTLQHSTSADHGIVVQ